MVQISRAACGKASIPGDNIRQAHQEDVTQYIYKSSNKN